ncbi:MAG: hypothetical protein RSA20_01800 [Oscillospiraceae bacterium]
MKKILYILFVIIIFTACSKTEQEAKPKTVEDVKLATIGWGPVINPSTFSNNGFYEIVHQPEGAANILYTDFATGTQMYLCSRPECLHNENSCNSYIEENIDTGRLLMNKDKSLLINIRGEKAAGTDEYITKIVTMKPDGSDQKSVYEFPFNESTDGHRAVDEENLYLTVIVAPTGVNKPAKLKLTRVNLYTGEREDLEAFDDDVKISAANEDTIYLQASTSTGNDFYAYSLSKKKKSLVYSTKYEEAKGVMFEDDLYLFENESKQVKQVNLITNEEKILEGKFHLTI